MKGDKRMSPSAREESQIAAPQLVTHIGRVVRPRSATGHHGARGPVERFGTQGLDFGVVSGALRLAARSSAVSVDPARRQQGPALHTMP